MLRRRALGVVAVLAVALTAACGPEPAAEPGRGVESPTTSAPAETDSGTPSETTDVTEVYTVPDPGRRQGPVTVADILVAGTETLPADVIDRIKALDDVVAVTSFSLASAPIENKNYSLAAVDLAEYRTFVEAKSADFADQWRRVAGGEVAVALDLKDKLPTDRRGYVALPAGGSSMKGHVGSYAEQATQIDMVVNAKFGEALGVVPDNALLINTGAIAPSELKKPIQQIVGDDVSVQNLDAAARYGIDLDAFQTPVLVGPFAEAVGVFTYTPIGGGRIAPDPAWVSSHIVTETVPILGSVTCNVYLMPQLKAALQEVVTAGLTAEIHPDEYAGCYYPRFIAGSSSLSNHSYGLALDFNVPGNQRGTVGEMDRRVVAIFKRWGFAWGGDWNYTDPMHFELDHLVKPG